MSDARRHLFTALIVLVVVLSTCLLQAQDTLLISYQGRLTDAVGTPVPNASYQLTFRLYDEGEALQWSGVHSSVQTTSGLFSVILGSTATLATSVFDTDPLYLESQVGTDEPMLPRTLLTSVPTAAVAKNMTGNVETGEGYLNLNAGDGSVAVEITTEGRGSPAYLRMYNPDIAYPDQSLLTMRSEAQGSALELYPAGGFGPNPHIRMGVEPSPFRTGRLEFFDPGGSAPFDPYIRMGIEPSPWLGAKLEMYDPGSGLSDNPAIRMGVEPTPFVTARFTMFDPQQADDPLLEMHASSDEGAGIDIYDEIGQVMSTEPSPFNSGYSIRLYDPNFPSDPPLAELSSNYAVRAKESYLRLYNPDAPYPEQPQVELAANGLTGTMKIGQGTTLEGTETIVYASAESDVANLAVKGGSVIGGQGPIVAIVVDDTEAKLGIGVNNPEEELDVRGIARVDAFKMPTSATAGYVLTSDSEGNGTWQSLPAAMDVINELQRQIDSLKREVEALKAR